MTKLNKKKQHELKGKIYISNNFSDQKCIGQIKNQNTLQVHLQRKTKTHSN
jgi:hypothetical protein